VLYVLLYSLLYVDYLVIYQHFYPKRLVTVNSDTCNLGAVRGHLPQGYLEVGCGQWRLNPVPLGIGFWVLGIEHLSHYTILPLIEQSKICSC